MSDAIKVYYVAEGENIRCGDMVYIDENGLVRKVQRTRVDIPDMPWPAREKPAREQDCSLLARGWEAIT